MKKNITTTSKNSSNNGSNGFLPSSLKFISSCIKTASSGVRSASASVASSISSSADSTDHKDQVLWASFDKLQLSPSDFKHVLLLGYSNGFQVLNVENGSDVNEIVSRRDDPVTFLELQPLPEKSEGTEGFRASHPLLLVVACDESKASVAMQNGRSGIARDGHVEPRTGDFTISPTTVRFYSLKSHSYVHVLRFRSTVYMVRCNTRIVAVGLAAQIYCFDALTLENKFSVLTYPVPQLGGQGMSGVNIGHGPMAVGPRWLAYASNNHVSPNTGRLSPQSLTPSPGVSPSTSPSGGSLVARYAMESSRQLASGLINLSDMSYRTLSKYYQEITADGSSPPTSSSSSKIIGQNMSHATETDVAGTVIVKDVVSRAVITQFRAHTSPISALCFDPSGTLLVTASVHGNNINVFRIMPSCSRSSQGSQSYDWNSSHVHLYKLHRGMTQAVIQNICFSPFSQWVAVVSSKGTCHIFSMAPFGGETVLQVQNSQVDGPTVSPALSLPWWSTSSFMESQRPFSSPSPPTVTLSVVSRIRSSNSGWLNIVSNAASSVAGKLSIPSGATASVFHSSVVRTLQPTDMKASPLEHLLVYTPSGHVLQYKLLPSIGSEPNENAPRTLPNSSTLQDEELRVRVEAVQWWDVCRRTDWPEKEEHVSEFVSRRQDNADKDIYPSRFEDSINGYKEMERPHEPSHSYLGNAEVHMSFGRTPIWQKSKIYFYTMKSLGSHAQNSTDGASGGEIEIDELPVNEIEIKRTDLLPVFDYFHSIPADWSGREASAVSHSLASSDFHVPKDKLPENALVSQSRFSHDYAEHGIENKSGFTANRPSQSANDNSRQPIGVSFAVKNNNLSDSPPALTSASLSGKRYIAKDTESSNSGGTSDVSNTSSNRSDHSMNICDDGQSPESLEFEQYFQEGYCKPQALGKHHETTDIATDVDTKSCCPLTGNKSEEDNASDDMLGGVFEFSEEG